MLGTLEQLSAQYIAGYVTKKLTMRDDNRLVNADGTVRYPEFARMSLRPGIGASAMDEVASEFMRLGLDLTQDDVPSSLRHGAKELPLGRYLQRQLRRRIGREVVSPKKVQIERSKEVLPLLVNSVQNSSSFKTEVLNKFAGKRASFESRRRIFKGKRSI